VNAAVGPHQAETAELAFGGRLVPVATAGEAPTGDRTDLRPSPANKPAQHADVSSLPALPDAPEAKAVTAVEATGLKDGRRQGNSEPGMVEQPDAARVERERKPSTAHTSEGEFAATSARSISEPARPAQEIAAADVGRPKADPAAPVREAAPLQAEAPKTASTATHDIKLEVGSGDQRVELHLVDHGGDVHVAVRTPDTHLAGELRENLPDLSSRLEQTGLRPEEWHTTTPVGSEWHRQVEHSSGANTNDPNGQSRQDTRERQDDRESRQPKVFEEQPQRKEKGKEFAWFMSTLH
jgi:hypothetical protein